ncbi:MAG: hypothetical protein ACUVX8_13530 [Candidatus Zipacnadales bacterium]
MYLDAAEDPQFLTVGAQRAYDQARVVYELLGVSDRLLLKTLPGGHDYGQRMREALYGFLAQHLVGKGDGSPIPEPLEGTPPPVIEDLWCFKSGKVPESSTTVRKLAEQWAQEAVARLPSPEKFDALTVRQSLFQKLHVPPQDNSLAELRPVGSLESNGLRVLKLKLICDEGLVLPALLVRREPGAPAVIIADGSSSPMNARVLLHHAHAAGFTALYVSPRGMGETAWDEHVICTDNILLGDPILGQRARDLNAARLALQQRLQGEHSHLCLLAVGAEAGLAGLFAQALWLGFEAVAVGPIPGSFLEAFGSGLPLMVYVPDILAIADIPQVATLAAERPLSLALTGNYAGPWYSDLAHHTTLVSQLDPPIALEWLTSIARGSR